MKPFNCPICGLECTSITEEVYKHPGMGIAVSVTPPVVEYHTRFLCYGKQEEKVGNTGAKHYYSHIVEESAPTLIIRQEFTIEYNHRAVLVNLDFKKLTTSFSINSSKPTIIIETVILPDFPHLTRIKKKISTYLIFQ